MRKTLMLCFLILSLGITLSNAQEVKSIDRMGKYGFRGLKSVIDKTSQEIVGHYVYYVQDRQLIIDFMDLELNITNHIPIEIPKNAKIDEAIYNGQDFLFLVKSRGSANAYTISSEGKRISMKTLAYHEDLEMSVYPSVSDGQFYLILPAYHRLHSGYKVQKVDVNFNITWEKEFVPEKGYTTVEAVQSGFDRLVVIQRTTPKLLFSKKAYAELVCFDDVQGDILFKSQLYDEEITAIPSQILIDEEQNIVAAGEFFKGTKMRNTNSKGVFIKKISPTGEDIAYNKQTWKKGIQKQLRKTKLRISGKNKVYFHSLVQGADGGYQAIGETFSTMLALSFDEGMIDEDKNEALSFANTLINTKNAAAALISGRYIGVVDNEASASTFTVQDFIIFNFDNDCNMEEVTKVKKDYTKLFVYYPYKNLAGLRLSRVVADYGFFDFSFTEKTAESEQKKLVYNATHSKRPHIGIATIEKGMMPTVRKIEFKELTGKKNSGKRGQAGCAQSNEGKLVVYYFVPYSKDQRKADKSLKGKGQLFMYIDQI